MDKVLQFEVWNECNNACKFCSNKYVYDITDEEKLRNLDIVQKKIAEPGIWTKYQKLGLIGGEFFQGQLKNSEVKQKYFSLIEQINQLLEAGELKEFWTTATLTFADQDDLWTMLSKISDTSKVWICTSYDTVGRFHSQKMLDQWKENMHKIKQLFPKTKINTTTILTGDFIEEYLAGKFSIAEFTEEFQSTWFSKPPMIPSECTESKKDYNEKFLPNFFPTRKRFLEFLLKFKTQESEFEYDKLFNTELRADALIKTDYHDSNNRMVIERNKETNEEVTKCVDNQDYESGSGTVKNEHNDTNGVCKHNKAYTPYVDSDACFYCDKEMIKQI